MYRLKKCQAIEENQMLTFLIIEIKEAVCRNVLSVCLQWRAEDLWRFYSPDGSVLHSMRSATAHHLTHMSKSLSVCVLVLIRAVSRGDVCMFVCIAVV